MFFQDLEHCSHCIFGFDRRWGEVFGQPREELFTRTDLFGLSRRGATLRNKCLRDQLRSCLYLLNLFVALFDCERRFKARCCGTPPSFYVMGCA
jgi:hypothetical protein